MKRSNKKSALPKRTIFLVFICIIFVSIQFYRPNRNKQSDTSSKDFLISEKAPEAVSTLFRNSCYNCHSDNTNYSWFDNIAPASWYVDNHIIEAKEELNFSKWKNVDYRTKRVHLSNIVTNIMENTMPLPSYTFMHPNAKLSEDQKKKIIDWLSTIEVSKT